MRNRPFLIRILCAVLVVASHTRSMAAPLEPPPPVERVLYLSKLPLASSDTRIKVGDNLLFYCAGSDFARVPGTDVSSNVEPPQIASCRNDRVFDGIGTKITVVYVEKAAGVCPADLGLNLVPTETARKTALAEGLTAVVKFAAKKSGFAGAPDGVAVYCYPSVSYVLQRDRATLQLAVSVTEPTAPAPAPAAAASAAAAVAPAVRAAPALQPPVAAAMPAAVPAAASGDEEKASYVVLTGSKEHFFLSGDAIVRGAKELKYDSTTKGVYERNKPDQLYLGVNALWGDVYGRYGPFDWNRFAGKLLITPSKRPFDSVGLGVGYRFKDLTDATNGPVASGGAMLFVGHFWTKGDSSDNDGGASNGKRLQSWRVGLSYSLDTLLGWLQ